MGGVLVVIGFWLFCFWLIGQIPVSSKFVRKKTIGDKHASIEHTDTVDVPEMGAGRLSDRQFRETVNALRAQGFKTPDELTREKMEADRARWAKQPVKWVRGYRGRWHRTNIY